MDFKFNFFKIYWLNMRDFLDEVRKILERAEGGSSALDIKENEIKGVEKNKEGYLKINNIEFQKEGERDGNILVSLRDIEKLNTVIGELLIFRPDLEKHYEHKLKNPEFQEKIEKWDDLVREVQEAGEGLRRVPLGLTFHKVSVMAQNTFDGMNRKINVELLGEDLEIDKTFSKKLSEVLFSIMGNVVRHGLEEIEKSTKSEVNIKNVVLSASYEGSNLLIKVLDDNRGGCIDSGMSIVREKNKKFRGVSFI